MEAYKVRVIDEKRELDDKISKLRTFIETDTFASLSPAERGRVVRQASIMLDYSEVLQEHITAFQ